MKLTTALSENIRSAKTIFPIGTSFDLLTRDLFLGETPAYWIGINGFCKNDHLQEIFSDLQNPLYNQTPNITDIQTFMNSKIGYAQAELTNDWEKIIKNVLSGASALFIDGFDQAILLDTRTYPLRSIEEPDTEKVTRGAKDGFIENILSNTILIRRRIRNPRLTFEVTAIGNDSKTDVAISYINGIVDKELLEEIKKTLASLHVTSLTMGSKSLEELIVKKRWYNPLPSLYLTERPDVACSYLLEGHILLIVDNSPSVLILPCTVFQFTQSPEDYYKSPAVGNYHRLVRFACLFVSLFLMPVFLLASSYMDVMPDWLAFIRTETPSPVTLFIYVLFIEFGLDLFKYSSAHSSSRFSSSLSIIGGLIIGDVAIELKWATLEVIFYGAATMLAALTIASIEFSEALRIYRIFLVLCTGGGLLLDKHLGLPGGLWGFIAGSLLILISILTTPVFAKRSYFWPLFPFNWKALKTLLFRKPTPKAQPSTVWKRR